MENFVNIKLSGMNLKVDKTTTYEQLAKTYKDSYKYPIILAKHGNNLRELSEKIEHNGEIDFFDITNEEGMRVYHRTILFVMIKAVKELMGNDTNVVVEHSLNKNLYCGIKKQGFKINDDFIEKLKTKMREIVNSDIPIIKTTFRREEATKLVKKFNMMDKAGLFRYRRSSNINLYEMNDLYDYFYGYMAPSTSYVSFFDIKLWDEGFLIIMPSDKNPFILNEFKKLPKISAVFREQRRWGNLMGVSNVSDLNDVIVEGKFSELIRINEALHEKKIAEIADEINKKIENIKIILIAGPSSSGKTTFAQRLSIQLRVNGIIPHAISLDDYFVDREKSPVDEFGKKDFENINALDIKQFNEDLTRLISGERVQIPSYNFVTGKREYRGKYIYLGKDEILVIEGIHGLNDILTRDIPHKNKFKIFISAITQLNIDDHNRISTSDSRLIRRIVRDHQFRGTNAAKTIDTWNSVRRGEEKNIFPYQENADMIFNSATIYELPILKHYIEPLLFNIPEDTKEHITAKRIIKFLDYFLGANPTKVPYNSIMREFLGDSWLNV